MAPNMNVLVTQDPLALDSQYTEEDYGEELTERKLEFNLSAIIKDIINIDYSKVVWRNVILFIVLHAYSIYGLYLSIFSAQWKTLAFSVFLYEVSALGITMGCHRLWAHRTFKAKFPLRVILAVFQTLAFQNSIFEWARDHRTHHKYSETNADPHNAKRGFFFCHMGWLMTRKHPDVIAKGKTMKTDDLLADPVVRFQKKYYKSLVLFTCFVLPTFIPCYFWGEEITTALFVPGFLRYLLTLHVTWLVNSLAHYIGDKPYDKSIYPSENKFVATFALGEGWHNYHHIFPFDYRAAELAGIMKLNVTSSVIDFCAKLGLAYDLRVVDPDFIKKRAQRTGDGSLKKHL